MSSATQSFYQNERLQEFFALDVLQGRAEHPSTRKEGRAMALSSMNQTDQSQHPLSTSTPVGSAGAATATRVTTAVVAGPAKARRNTRRYTHDGPVGVGPKSTPFYVVPVPHPAAYCQSRDGRHPKNSLLRMTAQVLAVLAAFAGLSMSMIASNPADRQLVIAVAVIMLLLLLRLNEAPITSNLDRDFNA
ncbi:MAG: hypothetical protein ACI9SE_000091 [Neolewinella sp.]